MRRGTFQKFSSGGSGFDPSSSKAEKVRIVGVDQIRQCSRMKRLENGADVESAQSEVCWARIQFNVTRKEEKGEEKRTADYYTYNMPIQLLYKTCTALYPAIRTLLPATTSCLYS